MTIGNKIVFDSSTLIAFLTKEKGFETIEPHLENAIISSVNIAEVYKHLLHTKNMTEDECNNLVNASKIRIIDFNQKQAFISAQIYKNTKEFGLSLGDRACIALAMEEGCNTLTCDKIWAKLRLDVECVMAR